MAKFVLKSCKIAKMLSHTYSVADPGSGALLTLDPGTKKNLDPGSIAYKQFLGLKYLNSLMRIRIRDPES
jgi:hypothetical protein